MEHYLYEETSAFLIDRLSPANPKRSPNAAVLLGHREQYSNIGSKSRVIWPLLIVYLRDWCVVTDDFAHSVGRYKT